MKRIIKAVVGFFKGQKEIVFDKEALIQILPHRKDKLLLDRVVITEQKVIGDFTITESVCDGHEISGILVMKGSDYYDMAAQLLGVYASQLPEILAFLTDGKTLGALRYGESLFKAPIRPGEKIFIEMSTDVEIDEHHGIVEIGGGRFVVRVDGNPKSRVIISSATLTPVDFKKFQNGVGNNSKSQTIIIPATFAPVASTIS